MPRCSFCKENYEFPIGLTLVLNDGNILYFCSGKCRKNMLYLKRDNKKVKWVKSGEDIAAEEIAKEEAEKSELAEKKAESKKEEKKVEIKKV